ncbi:hypothetical protein R1flu_000736 [Riccia fluitans]|uniref:COX assembly mitochondrial protein n=1 Tax=Riccia fluitans TaxID=41844 RepID=A0ABD1Y1A6_9MARC
MKSEDGVEEFYSDTEPKQDGESGGESRTAESAANSTTEEGSVWRWRGQPIGQKSIDEEKKREALVACSDLHATLVSCLRKGFTANCSEPQKAFWDCYAEHRGVRGNKIAAWFAPPSFSGSQKKEDAENKQRALEVFSSRVVLFSPLFEPKVCQSTLTNLRCILYKLTGGRQ